MKNEIRQGNYVSITPFEKETDILQLNEKEIEHLYIFGNWDRIKPIPLTEEWLLKIGFENNEAEKKYCKKCITLYMEDNLFWCDIFWDSLEIKSVHQLQNLYFALTNEELTIKL
jgi:hypothetical protein